MKRNVIVTLMTGVVCFAGTSSLVGEPNRAALLSAESAPPLAMLAAEDAEAQPQPQANQAKAESRNAPAANRAPTAGAVVSGGTGGFGGYGGGYGANGAVYSQRLQGIVSRSGGHGSSPLIIESAEPDPKMQANLQEDLAVMAHILDKTVSEVVGRDARYRTAMGIDVFWPDSRPMQNLYLEGYGVLFTLQAGFPLLAAPAKAEEEKTEANRDSAWEEAKQELYGETADTGVFSTGGGGIGISGAGRRGPGVPQKFDPGRVDQLKQSLLDSLKSAANIRNLKPDDWVTVCVFGTIAGEQGHRYMASSWTALGANKPAEVLVDNGPNGVRTSSIMTLRVKATQIDALSKGSLSAEDFRKQAQISIYPAEGGVVLGASSVQKH